MLIEPDVRKAQQIRPSVSAVILNERREAMLQRRSDNGRWGLPGGSVEIGESVTEAIQREVQDCRIVGGQLRTCPETLELAYFEAATLPQLLVPLHRIRITDALRGRALAAIR